MNMALSSSPSLPSLSGLANGTHWYTRSPHFVRASGCRSTATFGGDLVAAPVRRTVSDLTQPPVVNAVDRHDRVGGALAVSPTTADDLPTIQLVL
jgi:hypothetical protein